MDLGRTAPVGPSSRWGCLDTLAPATSQYHASHTLWGSSGPLSPQRPNLPSLYFCSAVP